MQDINKEFLIVAAAGNLSDWERWKDWQQTGDITYRDSLGNTGLHIAARECQRENVTLLLEEGAEVDAENEAGEPPVTVVAREIMYVPNKVEIIRIFLDGGATCTEAVLFFAAGHSNELLQRCIALGADLKVKSKSKSKSKSKDANLYIKPGDTLLHIAARGGHRENVALLLKKSAEVDAENEAGETPVTVAARSICSILRRVETMHILLDGGATCTEAVLLLAYSDYRLLKWCIQAQLNFQGHGSQDSRGNTILHNAAAYAFRPDREASGVDTFDLLIRSPLLISINQKNARGQTAFQYLQDEYGDSGNRRRRRILARQTKKLLLCGARIDLNLITDKETRLKIQALQSYIHETLAIRCRIKADDPKLFLIF
jgi:ankyrin repeat protein